jgi:hypothetical protein
LADGLRRPDSFRHYQTIQQSFAVQQPWARRFQEPAYHQKRSSAIAKKANKAATKLSSGKFKDKKDKIQLQKMLRKATQHACPNGTRRSCGRPNCPFQHSDSIAEENIRNIQGTIRFWKEDSPKGAYGFIDANGQSFYFKRSNLSTVSFLLPGTEVIFDSSPAPFEGGSFVAQNVRQV